MAQDAIALLEADHHRVEELFREFKSAGDPQAKLHLAQVICMELTLHAMVEEEIFYPAFARATGDEQVLQHALKEHAEIKELIAKVLTAENLDGAIEAVKQHTLHHVDDERKGMFAKARASGMELATLGGQIQARRAEVADAIQEA
ncbi:hemerythrin domain-containing protein [Caenimonas aquaedulcis]|uniref:Hemerythrin domain-containing protein n=1 Tax=Caenimonas aquaedulcis TaxID=2793270 RepID=A0A931H7D9_9BURK|nr:hemerythrin domain-containing protein [Caenimonas aquaedulcis]MBG9390044.1 hemerythrin domain-containing protein [Caenimonas aquaedulcis]